MLVTIIYNISFRDEAGSLDTAIKERWNDAQTNLMGVRDNIGGAQYQVQLNGAIIYRGNIPGSNSEILSLIEDGL